LLTELAGLPAIEDDEGRRIAERWIEQRRRVSDGCRESLIVAYGNATLVREFERLAEGAAIALASGQFAADWLSRVFEVGWSWRRYPGTPLRVERWTARAGVRLPRLDTNLPARNPLIRCFQEMLVAAESWTASSLPDVFAASAGAIDILLTTKAAAVPQRRKRGRPVKDETEQRATFAAAMLDRGLTWTEIASRYGKRYPEDREASADTIRKSYLRVFPPQKAPQTAKNRR